VFCSFGAYFVTNSLIHHFMEQLERRGLFGKDLNKAGDRETKKKVPEALGIVMSIVFLLVTI